MIKIINKPECSGCMACVNACPKQCIFAQKDDQGFLYPKVKEENCIDCHICERVCPIGNSTTSILRRSATAYAAYNTNATERQQSSSGGIFMEISKQVIRQCGIVFGARFDEHWNVEHSYAQTEDEAEQFRRSKYIQSNIKNTYTDAKAFLNEGKTVLFSGTPCQIAGLKRFLGKEYDNLLTIDFICHGVPSATVWQKYLQEQKERLANKYKLNDISEIKILSINFRDKSSSWRQYNLKITFNITGIGDVIITEPVWENDYMLAFLNDYANRPSCFKCQFRNGKANSDLTIADFWGIENCIESLEFAGEQGTSLLILNNDRLRHYLTDVMLQEVPLEKAISGNIAYTKDWPKPLTHDYFFHKLKSKSVNNSLKKAQEAERKLLKYKDKAQKKFRYKIKYTILKLFYT